MTAAEPGGELARIGVLLRLHLKLSYRIASSNVHKKRFTTVLQVLLAVAAVGLVAALLGYLAFKISHGIGPAESGIMGVFIAFSVVQLYIFGCGGIFEKGMGCGIDLARLFHLPVPGSSMLAAGLGARFLAPHSLLPLGFIAGYAWAALAAGLYGRVLVFVLVSAPLWLLHLHLIAMVLSLLTSRARRSRRFMEAMTIIGLLVFIIYLVLVMTPLAEDMDALLRSLLSLLAARGQALLPVLRLLPGIAPLTWQVAGAGAPLLLATALIEALVLFALGCRLLERLQRASLAETATPSRSPLRSGKRGLRLWLRLRVTRLLDLLPLFARDVRLTLRDPATRIELMMMAGLPVLLVMLLARFGHDLGHSPIRHILPLLIIFLLKDRLDNHLCREADGLVAVLTSSLPRWRILLEKNLSTLAIVLVLVMVVGGLLVWHGAPVRTLALDLGLALALALPFLGVGNLLAITLPLPQTLRKGELAPQVPLTRLLLVELIQLGLFALVTLLVTPVLAAHLVTARAFAGAGTLVLVSVLSLLYSGGLYWLLLLLANDLLLAREPELYEKAIRARG